MIKKIYPYLTFSILLLSISTVHAQTPPGGVTTDLTIWYDAGDVNGDDNYTNNPADSTEIMTWVDKSGNGNDAVVSTGKNGAILETDPFELINGRPVLKFNQVSQSLGSIYHTGVDVRASVMEDMTIFLVYKPKTAVTGNSNWQSPWGNDNGAWDRFYYSSLGADPTSGIVSLGNVAPSSQTIPEAGKIDEVYLQTTAYNGDTTGGVNSGPTGGSAVYFNGDLIQAFTDNTHASAAYSELSIGWDGDSGAFDGQIAEVMVYSRILTACELEQINNALGLKYGKDFSGFAASYDPASFFNLNPNAIGISASACGSTVQVDEAASSQVTINNPTSNDTQNEFLIIAHNDVSGEQLSINIPVGATIRMDRVWRVEEETNTNTNGAGIDLGLVDVIFDLSTIGLTDAGVNEYVLLIDSEGTDFSNASIYESAPSVKLLGTYANGKITFSGVNLDHDDHFTLAVLDNIPPTVTIEQSATQSDPYYEGFDVRFTASFSEAMDASTFTCSDLTIGGTATSACTSITEVAPFDKTTYEILITATTIGTVTVEIPANTVQDFALNDNSQSTSTDNSVTIRQVTWQIGITPAQNGSEDGTDVIYVVNLIDDLGSTYINNTNAPITAGIAFTGSADQSDFTTSFPTVVSIADGMSSATVTLTVNDDTTVDPNENITATLSSPLIGIVDPTDFSDMASIDDNDDDDGDGVENSVDQCEGFDDNLDNDSDGVPDACDLDDDNDGILDTEEGCYVSDFIIDFNTSNEDWYFGTNYTYEKYPVFHSSSDTLNTGCDMSDIPASPAGDDFIAFDDPEGGDSYFNNSVAFSNLLAENFLNGQLSYYWINGSHNGQGGNDGSQTDQRVYLVSGGTSIYHSFDATGMAHNGWQQIIIDLNTSSWINNSTGVAVTEAELLSVLTDLNKISIEVEMISGKHGLSCSNDREYYAIDHIQFTSGEPCKDTDDDSIADYLDTDSDNDGCPDAIEGAGSFTLAEIQNDTLTGGVDADGIPNLASPGGQLVGTSTDASQQAGACSTIAENDINQTPMNTAVAGNVLTNDEDPTGDAQTVTAISYVDVAGDTITVAVPTGGVDVTVMLGDGASGTAGTLAINEDGEYTFTPATGYTGDVPAVTYEVTDATGATDIASLDLDVIPTNDPATDQAPVANDDTNTTDQDVTVTGNFIDGNDSDPDTPQDDLVVTAVSGLDVNGDPLAIILGDPAVNIYDEDGTIAGTITVGTDGSYTFDPAPTFTGDVPVSYTIQDPEGNSGTADLTLTVNPDPSGTINNSYTNDDASSGPAGEDLTGNVLTNDNDPEGDDQDITLIDTDGDGVPDATPVAGVPTTITQGGVPVGTLTVDPETGIYVWTPEDGFVETVAIPYTACDDASTAACGTATLYVTTLPVNTTSSTDDFTNTSFDTPVNGDASTNDKDAEANTQAYTLLNINGGMYPGDGSVVLSSDGTYVYTPGNSFTGETSFDYVVCDDGTPVICDTSTVYIEVFPAVNPENTLVIANPDANTVEEAQTGTGNVLSNDLDPDDLKPSVTTPLGAVVVAGVDEDGNPVANAGTLTLSPNGSYTFEPTAGFTGTVTQAYTICNSTSPAVCDDTELMIEVIPNNGNTTFVNDDALVIDAGVTATGDVSENDTDSELNNQNVTSFMIDTDGDGVGDTAGSVDNPTTVGGFNDMGVFVPNAGSLTLETDGTYTFIPAVGFVGNINIPYTACDDATPTVACDAATLVITILDVKRDYGDAPAAYPIAWHRAMVDTNTVVLDNTLDGATDVWLGMNTGFETSQPSNSTATGDSFDDAITFGSNPGQFPLTASQNTAYNVDVVLNGNTPGDVVFYGMWIDWDADGSYDDFYAGSGVTNSPDTVVVIVTTPAGIDPITINVRLRADDDPLIEADSTGGKTNGEIEDYQNILVLPVELTSFEGRENNCDVELNWLSAMEDNFSHYEVERSEDGLSYTKLETIRGTQQSTLRQHYEYLDDSASAKNYYRLKMVDLDGTFEYSDVVRVATDCADGDDDVLNIYPNPVGKYQGLINVDLTTSGNEVEIVINDMLGRILKRLSLGVQPDMVNTVRIDVHDLPVGSYTISVVDESKSSGSNAKMFIIHE